LAVLFRSFGEPGTRHALPQAALFHERSLQLAELLIEQVSGQLN
jgi:hypothetical protein